MRKMKDSGVEWIGEIPEHWEIRKIKHLPDPNTDNNYIDGDWIESVNISDSGIRYLTTGNIGDGIYKEQGSGYISQDTFDELKCKYAYPGDLVISRLNSPYGRSCILPDAFPKYVLAVDNVILRPVINKKYICYATQCEGYQYAVEDQAKGTTMKRISRTNLGNIVLPVPSMNEQRKIVEYLDTKCEKIDLIIEKQIAIIEKLKTAKQKKISEVVREGLQGETLKETRYFWIGKIPYSWNVGQLKFFANIRAGITLGKTYRPEEALVEVPYLRVANVQGEYVDLSDVSTLMCKPEEVEKYSLHKGELLMTEGGDRDKLGRGCVWNEEITPCIHQNHVFAVTTDETVLDVHFLDYVTTSDIARTYFDFTAKKTTNLASTNSTAIMQFRIPLPPLEQQKEIVAYLDKVVEQYTFAINTKIEIVNKFQEYKKSLIYEVVTGKKEV